MIFFFLHIRENKTRRWICCDLGLHLYINQVEKHLPQNSPWLCWNKFKHISTFKWKPVMINIKLSLNPLNVKKKKGKKKASWKLNCLNCLFVPHRQAFNSLPVWQDWPLVVLKEIKFKAWACSPLYNCQYQRHINPFCVLLQIKTQRSDYTWTQRLLTRMSAWESKLSGSKSKNK